MKVELKPVLSRQQAPRTVTVNTKPVSSRMCSISQTPVNELQAQSYARVLAAVKTPILSYRNIVCEGANATQIQERLAKDNICSDIKVLAIKKKGKNFTTVKCANEEEAQKFEQIINRKYKNEVTITKVNTKKPQIKITNINIDMQENTTVELLKEQNYYLENKDISIQRSYIIETEKRKYKNIIINVDLDTQ